MAQSKRGDHQIPVVDIFAGPGGLGEGFSSLETASGCRRFRIDVSIEKDEFAWRTLHSRAFRRQFEDVVPETYRLALRGEVPIDAAYAQHARQTAAADAEAIRLELGAANSSKVVELVRARIAKRSPWVLVGGPPCQAYSLIGRARNKGNSEYVPEADHRQKLYVEYLDILAHAAPDVFVMENVKGLLSAQFGSQRLFGRIMDDLRSPAKAIEREGRPRPRSAPRYAIHALVPRQSLFDEPADYIVRAEHYGVPQARHRVILLGIREGAGLGEPGTLVPSAARTVASAIDDLPRLRSGVSDAPDSWEAWHDVLAKVPAAPWFSDADAAVQEEIRRAVAQLRRPRADRGAEFLPGTKESSAVRVSRDAGGYLNHSTRSHMASDLERYLFVSAFGRAAKRSPSLPDFPKALLPSHRSAGDGTDGPAFADRFRVQLAHRPATTVTSHIAKDGHYYIHPDPTQCRSLTVREAARLQTFPEDYFFCGPRTAQYHQVGNAVPPLLAGQIARIVSDLLK